MRTGTFGRSFDTFDKALTAASKHAKHSGFRIPIFRMQKDICDEREIYIVLFHGKAEHILTVGPGADVKVGDDEAPARDEPVPA